MKSAALLGIGALAALAGGSRSLDSIRPGERVTLELTAGARAPVQLALPPGTWHVVVESDDFDVAVAAGVARELRDGDAAAGFGERVALHVDEAAEYDLEVAASDGSAGSFTVRVAAPDPLDAIAPARELDALERVAARTSTSRSKLQQALVEALRSSAEWQDLASFDRALEMLTEEVGTPAARATGSILRELRPAPAAGAELLETALEDLDTLLWGVDVHLLTTLGSRATAEGRHGEAFELFEEALRRAQAADDPLQEALVRCNIHYLLQIDRTAEDRADRIREALEGALSAVDRAVGREPPRAARYRIYLARSLWRTGEHSRAHAVALAGLDPDVAPAQWLVLQVLLCQIEARQHRFVEARDRARRVARVIDRRGVPEQDLARIEDLSSILFTMGNYADSARRVEQVLELTRETGGVVRADALITRALILETEEDLEAAERAWRDALELLSSLPLRSSVVWGRTAAHIGQGRVLRLLGRLDEAEACFDRALEICDQYELDARVAALHGLAEVQFARGELEISRDSMRPVVAHYEKTEDHDALFAAWETMGRIELARGEEERVAELLDAADRRLEKAEALGAWGAAAVRSRYADFARLAQDLTARRWSGADSDVERAPIAAAGLRRAGGWKARALLARLRPAEGFSEASAAAIATIQARLGPGTVLVEYAGGRERLYAYRLDHAGVTFHELGSRAALEEEVRSYREDVLVGVAVRDPKVLGRRGRSLYDRLLAPVLGELPPERLVIVPEGILATIPFEALVVGDGADEPSTVDELTFLLDRARVRYSPSVPVLVVQDRLARLPLGEGRAILLGDAIMPSEGGDPGGPLGLYKRLEATRDECIDIADAYLPADADGGGARRDQLSLRSLRRDPKPLADPRFDLYLGGAATPARLVDQDLSEYAVVHLATHGVVDRLDPTQSGLLLSPDPDGTRVLDVARIRTLTELRGLVVLSACETLRGPLLRGEGVQSIGSAFLEVGARGVVASLWAVDDERTRTHMVSLYRGVLSGDLGPAAALDAARRELRHHEGVVRGLRVTGAKKIDLEYAHPHVWAPFVYWGQLE